MLTLDRLPSLFVICAAADFGYAEIGTEWRSKSIGYSALGGFHTAQNRWLQRQRESRGPREAHTTAQIRGENGTSGHECIYVNVNDGVCKCEWSAVAEDQRMRM